MKLKTQKENKTIYIKRFGSLRRIVISTDIILSVIKKLTTQITDQLSYLLEWTSQ